MDLRRLRSGEWIAGVSGLVLLVALFLPWYSDDGGSRTGWQSLGALDVVLAVVALAAIAIPIVTALERVHGILLQLPLPDHLDQDQFISLIDPAKDVDGLTSTNAGLLMQDREEAIVPCTPAGVMELLREAEVELKGARAVVLGRSILVGKPVLQLLLAANATVTQCHSRTRDLPAVCREGDVLIAAVGSPRLVTADMVRDGAVVIDVGTNRTDDGLVGDVDFEAAKERARAITPVPGGVGPMTRAMLLVNTLKAARARGS